MYVLYLFEVWMSVLFFKLDDDTSCLFLSLFLEWMELHYLNTMPILQKKNQIAIGQPARLRTCSSNDAFQRRKHGHWYARGLSCFFFCSVMMIGHPVEEPGSTFYRHARVLRSPWNN